MSAATRNPYRVPQGYVSDPFAPLYQQPDEELSEDLSVQLILDYANQLDDKIAGDFDLGGIINEIKSNTLSFVRIGLIAFKVKVLKIYRQAYSTFKDFCEKAIGITTWQVNRMIEASRVVIELAQGGFDVLPKNEAQARPLTKLSGADLYVSWETVLNSVPEYKITSSTIAETLGMEVKSKSLRLPPDLYYALEQKAFEAGMSIKELLEDVVGEDNDIKQADEQKVQAWQEDLDTLIADKDSDKEEPKSEPIVTVSTPKSEPIVTVSTEPTLTEESLTVENLDEPQTDEDYLQDDEQHLTHTQTPLPHQNTRTSPTQKPSSSNQASTSVLTEDKESDQPLPAKKPPKIKSFLNFNKGSSKKKRNKRGFGR